jgi:hypothetical protein
MVFLSVVLGKGQSQSQSLEVAGFGSKVFVVCYFDLLYTKNI